MSGNIELNFSVIPQELKMLRQWVCWHKQQGENGKMKKIPLDPKTGHAASTTDNSTWASFEKALKAAQDNGLFTTGAGGIGFVFSENDNFCGVDLDDAINESGEISEFANEILRELDSYTEISQSGRGLHIIIRIAQPLSIIGSGRKMKVGTADFECYDAKRYFIMTGKPYGEIKPIAERTETLKKIYAMNFRKQPQAKRGEKISCEVTGNDSANFYGGVDERSIEAQFFKSLSDYGITPRENFIPILDGMIHRFSTIEDKPGQSSGAYYIHADGWPNWGFRDFRKHDEMQKIKFPFTADERREYLKSTTGAQREQSRREAEALRAENIKRRQVREEQSKKKAKLEYDETEHAKEFYTKYTGGARHPYLVAKNITNEDKIFFHAHHILKVKIDSLENDICRKGDLLIPLVNSLTGDFQSLQRIAWKPDNAGKFQKEIYAGTSLTGACCELIPFICREYHYGILKAKRIFICEGVATGFSVLEILENKEPVLCAMTCHNIFNVARNFRTRYQKQMLEIIIAADNDEAGITSADKTIAAGYADKKIVPTIAGMDWNDFVNAQKAERITL